MKALHRATRGLAAAALAVVVAGCIGTEGDRFGGETGNLEVRSASVDARLDGRRFAGEALEQEGWCHSDGFRVRTVSANADGALRIELRVADADVRLDADGIAAAVEYDGWSATFSGEASETDAPGVLGTTSNQAGTEAELLLEAYVGPREGEWTEALSAEEVELTIEPTSARRRSLHYSATFADGQTADGTLDISMPQND